jgi:hypothetical protein
VKLFGFFSPVFGGIVKEEMLSAHGRERDVGAARRAEL